MLGKILTPIKVAIALLPIAAFGSNAYAANLGGEVDPWSTEEFLVVPNDYQLSDEESRLLAQELVALLTDYQEILEDLDPQLDPESEFVRISLAAMVEDSETATYFEDLLSALGEIDLSPVSSTNEAYVPILPQVEYSEIFKGIYDFNIQSPGLNQRQGGVLVGRPRFRRPTYSGGSRPLTPRSAISFLYQSRPDADFFSLELSNFGDPVIETEFSEQPRAEFLLALSNYQSNLTSIEPELSEFGRLAFAVEMPRLPQERLPKQVYNKYFANGDDEVQQRLQRQAEKQARAQKKHLRRLQNAQ